MNIVIAPSFVHSSGSLGFPMTPTKIARRIESWSDNSKGAAILVVAAGLFTIMTALIKTLGTDLHVTQILFMRQVVMTMIIAPRIVRGFPGVLVTKRPLLQLVRVCLALTAMLCGFTAIINMPLADATAIGFTKGFFVTIFAVFILAETVGPYRWGAVFVGFVGVAIMLGTSPAGADRYALMALAGAAGAGMVMVIIRLLSRTEASITILAWQAIGVGVAMAVPAIYFWQWPSPTEWILLGAMGIVSYAAQLANITAFRFGEASLLASLDYVRLVYATLFGWLFFATLPGFNTYVGASIIVAAAIYTVWREGRRNQLLSRSPEGRGYNH
jgi:drug/metabolite transporter (DMT)-like permease